MVLIAFGSAILLMTGHIRWPADRAGGAAPWAVLTAFGNAVLLAFLAGGWLWPRWPEQPPTRFLRTALDPLGNALPLFTAALLGVNLLVGLTALDGLLAGIQAAASVIGFALLAGALWRRPRRP